MAKTGGIIYAIGIKDSTWVKIGYTTGPIAHRLKALQTAQPRPLYVIATVRIAANLRQVERQMHGLLASVQRRGEWFDLPMNEATFKAMIGQVLPTPLGTRIRTVRQRYGMSQTVLAERIGLSKTSLSLIESGETRDPRYSIVRRIAQVLRLRMDDLDPIGAEDAIHA